VQYDGSTFGPFGGLTPSLSWKAPTLTATGSAATVVTPTIDVLIDGLGGSRIDLNAGLRLAADTAATPWWKLTAPIQLGAQLRLDVWKARHLGLIPTAVRRTSTAGGRSGCPKVCRLGLEAGDEPPRGCFVD